MEVVEGAPEWVEMFTAAERPDLWNRAEEDQTFRGAWPEYNHHGNHASRYFASLFPRLAHLQLLVTDKRSLRIVARGRTIPFRWDGTLRDLPPGIDALGIRALDAPDDPTALSALAAEVHPGAQGAGLSVLVIKAMAQIARSVRLAPLVAPVRPSWKDRYPLTSIERYVAWTKEDGLPFDPWIRAHRRLGGRILRCEPRSMGIEAPIGDWEAWTGMRFPDDGEYTFPQGLAPLTIRGRLGQYDEPNVWILHDLESHVSV